ncbi:aldose epimerase family protein [Kineococcus gynurae]|uniref:Aldose 1-epimerase n=1 Tax=Kineococcus gynurae TaxID=452979 RepID=A0ABV5LSE2_9ACTN
MTTNGDGVTHDGGRWQLDDGTVRVALLDHGARVQSVTAPDREGRPGEVVLGFASPEPYREPSGEYLGASIGRYANRLRGGRFQVDGVEFAVPANDRGNALHGGPEGFSGRVWESRALDDRRGVRFSLLSRDGDNGFPGNLSVHVDYVLDDASLIVEFSATTDSTTVLNLTNHAYFNLAGEGSGSVETHLLQVEAESYLPIDTTGLPEGIRPVAGTPFDLRRPASVGARLAEGGEQLDRGVGFDHCFVLSDEPGGSRALSPAVRLVEEGSGRSLELWTDQPGVQVYTGGHFDGTLVGASGRSWPRFAGIALEPQGFPDAPNRPEFPPTELRTGEEFRSVSEFRFGLA